MATAAVEPLLDGQDLASGLDPQTKARSQPSSENSDGINRLRLRDLDGHVVFTSDGSGLGEEPETEALEAAEGNVEAELTRLNSDANDTGPVGAAGRRGLPPPRRRPRPRTSRCPRDLPALRADPQATSPRGLHDLYRTSRSGCSRCTSSSPGCPSQRPGGCDSTPATNAYLAEYDQLTGLPNRRMFRRQVAELTDGGQRLRGRCAHRPRPVQGSQRLARPPQRRPAAHPARSPPRRGRCASRRHRRPARR